MTTVIFHGRAGQPVPRLAELLAAAALRDGRFSQTWRVFSITPVRGPIAAVTRVSDRYIRERAPMTVKADWAVVLDPSLIPHLGAQPAPRVLCAPPPPGVALPAGWQRLEVPAFSSEPEVLSAWAVAVAEATGLASPEAAAAASGAA